MAAQFQLNPIEANLTLSGSAATAWADETLNAYNFTGAGTSGGPTYNATAFGGYPSLTFNGSDHYMINSAGAPGFLSGNDQDGYVIAAARFISNGASGDALIACGSSSTNNPFIRMVEDGVGSFITTKRDDSTSSGSGAGYTAGAALFGTTRAVFEWERAATTVAIYMTTTTAARTQIATATSNVGTTTVNQIAIGALPRITISGFGNWEVAYVYADTTIPTGTTLTSLLSFFSKFISPPQVLNSAADRVRRDRHLHAVQHERWEMRGGLYRPVERPTIVQVNGLRHAA